MKPPLMFTGSPNTQSGGCSIVLVYLVLFKEGIRRCLNLLHDHPKRDELLEVLVDAGESAWARGAHEVSSFTDNREDIFSDYM